MLGGILFAAQAGVSLLGARSQARASEQQMEAEIERAGITAGRAAFAGPLERFQIRQQARFQEQTRARDFSSRLASQRSSAGASGIIGGRTQRLIRARSQAEFTRQEALAGSQERFALASSRERERAAREDAAMQMSDAGRAARARGQQVTASLFGNLLGAAQSANLFDRAPGGEDQPNRRITPSSHPGRPGGEAGTRF